MTMRDKHAGIERLSFMLLTLLLASMTTWAQNTFSGNGTGASYNPYLISSVDHLVELANDVNNGYSYEGKYFEVTEDIDCQGRSLESIGGKYFTTENNWVGQYRFRGSFNGRGKTISNFKIESPSGFFASGLFGLLGNGAEVYGVTVSNATVMAMNNCGGIAGYVEYGANVHDCQVSETVTVSVDPSSIQSAPNSGRNYFGGIAGYNDGVINSCISQATVTDQGYSDKVHTLGGIAGYNNRSITNCFSIANVIGTDQVGGIAGANSADGVFIQNYYHHDTHIGAVNGSDKFGARWMGTISYSSEVSGTVRKNNTTSYSIGNQYYYFADLNVIFESIDYHPQAPEEGMVSVAESLTYYANGVEMADMNGKKYFTMPAEDVTVTATATGEVFKRDIAYTKWVTVSIPEQPCTGSTLTPAITVTDAKDGSSVTLVEGIHYTVSMPQEMKEPGYYDIVITGMGDFAGTRTERFHITAKGVWSGEGTASSPYLITSVDDMGKIVTFMDESGYAGTHFRLEADLDFVNDPAKYKMIGSVSVPFNGTFDGNHHSIREVKIGDSGNVNNNTDNCGLFRVIGTDGQVMNLTLEGQINGMDYVGGIAGYNYGLIENCVVNGEVNALRKWLENPILDDTGLHLYVGGNYAGGIVGYNKGTLKGNRVEGAIVNGNSKVVGAILGEYSGGTLANNYYDNCSVKGNSTGVGSGRGDITANDGAVPLPASFDIRAHEAELHGVKKFWATYYHPSLSFQLPSEVQAFYVKSDKSLYLLGDGTVIPAGTAVVLMGNLQSFSLQLLDSTPSVQAEGNILRGTGSASAPSSLVTGSQQVYVLSKVGNAFGFFRMSGDTMPANKAYYVE